MRIRLQDVLVTALVLSGAQAMAQGFQAQATEDSAQREALTTAIVDAREAAAGRDFGPALRSTIERALEAVPLDRLQAFRDSGGTGDIAALGGGEKILGDPAVGLVFTPVTPCRVIDTRSGGGVLAGNSTRAFVIAGTLGFPAQGGLSGGCGIPLGSAAVELNTVAVNPSGAGNIRAFPFGGSAPNASVVNYTSVPGLNIANGIAQPICNILVSTCTSDLTLQADVSGTDIVADVVGYYRRVDSTMASHAFNSSGLVAGDNYLFPTATYVAPSSQKCLVTSAFTTEAGTASGFLRVALRNETTATNGNYLWGVYLANAGTSSTATNANVVTLTAGQTYKFGCYLSAGAASSAGWYCSVAYHCQ